MPRSGAPSPSKGLKQAEMAAALKPSHSLAAETARAATGAERRTDPDALELQKPPPIIR